MSLNDFLTLRHDNWALKPQLFWLRNRAGNIPIDFIGRFENLATDWERVAHKIGLEDSELPHLIGSPDTNRGDKTPPEPSTGASVHSNSYVEAFDDELRKLVYRRYQEEIELFNYRFDGV